MKYTRKWEQRIAHWSTVAEQCQILTDKDWIVHSVVYMHHVNAPGGKNFSAGGAIIVAFKDEPDLSGGVPR